MAKLLIGFQEIVVKDVVSGKICTISSSNLNNPIHRVFEQGNIHTGT